MKKPKTIPLPKVDDEIYIPTSLHVYRGADDFIGGLCTINRVETSKHLPPDHCNYIMIGVEEDSSSMYNYKGLLKEQSKLKKQFGKKRGHPQPDLRPEFNCPDADWR